MKYSLVTGRSQCNELTLQYVRSMLQMVRTVRPCSSEIFINNNSNREDPYSEATYALMKEAALMFGIQADAEDDLSDFYSECVYGSNTNVFMYESNGDEFFHESNKPFACEV